MCIGKSYERADLIAQARRLLARAAPGAASRVLVIDDSLTYREALCDILREQGYRVDSAASGEEGLRCATAQRPDVLIVDGQLPGIDGATVVRKLRLNVALRDTPCILLTGAGELGAELAALNSGADGFVRKQEDPELLLARVAALLRKSADTRHGGASTVPSGPYRVLAVDDSPTYLEALSESLREEGYTVLAARSGEEALESVTLQAVDCILLDRLMPGMGGTETCRRIKASPALRDIPLIMLTGTEDRDAMIEGLATGADDYVLKSSELAVLKARVSAQLRRKQFEDENRRIRLELLNREVEATEARAARELAESRAQLLRVVEQRNQELEALNQALQLRQQELDQSNTQLAAANRQLEEASRLKSEFLSTMSHELRTPLNAIIGFAELFKDGALGDLAEEQRKFVAAIYDSGEHLLQLINEVLDLSKIEAGRMELELEAIELEQMLADSLTVVRERAGVNHIGVDCQTTGAPRVRADRRRLRQILYNLLSNAVKFTPEGGSVHLHACCVDRQTAATALPGFAEGVRMPLPDGAAEQFAQISVTDTGIGIAAADIPRLFTPFSQLDSSLSRKAEGTGLGLAVVRQLAELHGGTVAMSSKAGQGSCFCVWLPLWEAEPGAAAAVAGQTAGQRQALVIEDDPHAAELVTVQLGLEGFDCLHVPSVEAALALADRVRPALILLDLLLPGRQGWELLPLAETVPAWAGVPVVVISVDADRCRGMALGVDRLLQKPIRREQLADCLAELGFSDDRASQSSVLLVDDDPAALELMSTYLGQAGFRVDRAGDGRSGLRALQTRRPDLIVLDLLMPGFSGFDFMAALNADPAIAGIPTLVVTASQPDELARARLGRPVLSLAGKPDFDPRAFTEEVRRAVRGH